MSQVGFGIYTGLARLGAFEARMSIGIGFGKLNRHLEQSSWIVPYRGVTVHTYVLLLYILHITPKTYE